MTKSAADIVEDLEWLDRAGVGAFEAARRTAFPSAHAMEQWLGRKDQYPLWLRMKHRDPEGSHEKRHVKETAVTSIDPIIALLDRAHECPRKVFGRRADKVRTLIKALRTDLDAYDKQQEAEAEARGEIERLEAELADAKSRLRKTPAPSAKPAATGEAAAIRVWARENGVACPAMGRIPTDVREAYETREGAA